MPVIMLYFFSIVLIIAFVIITHAILNIVFDGNYVFIQALLEFCMDVFCGLYLGRIIGRRLLYTHMKNLYKKQEKTTKGEYMSCIATTLTIISVFSGGTWNDVSVSTNSHVLTRAMNEQVSAKIEMLSTTKRKSETFTVACGKDVYAATTSALEIVQ